MILGAAHLSDRIGRRPVFAFGAALAAVSAFPIFALFDTKNAALITVAVVIGWGFAACTMFGAEGVLFAEVFPTRVRYSGMIAVYQLGVMPTGAVAPIIGTSLVSPRSGTVLAGGGLRRWRWPRSRWCRWCSCRRPSAATCVHASAYDATPDPALTGAGSPR